MEELGYYGTVATEPPDVELSVVVPCLNEAETLATCIDKALRVMREHEIPGEVIVADNGSTDGSQQIAVKCGARLVELPERGYGSALMGGIKEAAGKYVIMGDADDSYDFLQIPQFLEKLRQGYELVQGCRLPSGGGTVLPGAMPVTHRWLGNPIFSSMVRRMFKAPIHDVYCGMRGFTKSLFERLDMRCTGMEFATEMIIKASLRKERIAEVPITLHPDGRVAQAPHLRTIRDGWRTLRFFLMSSPRWLFLYPGLLLVAVRGWLGYGLALPGVTIFGATLDVHTLLFASLFIMVGYQALLFAVMAKTFAMKEKLLPPDPTARAVLRDCQPRAGAGPLGAGALGRGCDARLCRQQVADGRASASSNYPVTMRWVIPGVTLTALGFQTVLSGFLVSILRMAALMTDAGDFGSEFDRSAAECDASLRRGLRYSGEGKSYFAAGRIDFLARRLRDLDAEVGAVMDFGCGAGDSCQLLLDRIRARTVLGSTPQPSWSTPHIERTRHNRSASPCSETTSHRGSLTSSTATGCSTTSRPSSAQTTCG